jgi:hypothetical protein
MSALLSGVDALALQRDAWASATVDDVHDPRPLFADSRARATGNTPPSHLT